MSSGLCTVSICWRWRFSSSLPVVEVLRSGYPLRQAACNHIVVGGRFLENLVTVVPHGIERDPFVGRHRLQKAHGLFADHGEVSQGEIASVQQKDDGVALSGFGFASRAA